MKGYVLFSAAMLSFLIIGCSGSGSEDFVPKDVVSTADPLPLGEVVSLTKSDKCLYYFDLETENVMRVSLDGVVREPVVECGSVAMTGFAGTDLSASSQGRLHLRSVPGGVGYTVLDVASPRATIRIDSYVRTAQVAYIANSDIKTKWKYTLEFGPYEIEPGHDHDYIDKISFTDGSSTYTYDFVVELEGHAGFLGMADDDHAVLLDMPNVIVWNIVTDENTCIANVKRAFDSAKVWPRNLHLDERFAPIAKASDSTAVYEWEMSDPSDFQPKPEYVKRKLSP